MVDINIIIYWVSGFILAIALIAGVWVGAYYTWLDKRLRVLMFNSKSGLDFFKTNLIDDNRFRYMGGVYMVDKKAIYRRFFRIPYSIYFFGNPNPMMIDKQTTDKKINKIKVEVVDEKTGKTIIKEIEDVQVIYTAQELHNLLEVNYTLNLIKPPVNVKKVIMTLGIVIAVGIIALLILHFTGVVDIRDFLGVATPT